MGSGVPVAAGVERAAADSGLPVSGGVLSSMSSSSSPSSPLSLISSSSQLSASSWSLLSLGGNFRGGQGGQSQPHHLFRRFLARSADLAGRGLLWRTDWGGRLKRGGRRLALLHVLILVVAGLAGGDYGQVPVAVDLVGGDYGRIPVVVGLDGGDYGRILVVVGLDGGEL